MKIIFEESLKRGIFREICKKANAVPVHKEEDKTLIKKIMVLFIGLLPIFGKIFKGIIYKLFMPSESGFIPGDSCIAQLLSIIPEVQTDFYNIPTVDLEMQFNKMIRLIRQLSISLFCNALLTIYISFMRPHLDYGDILYVENQTMHIFRTKWKKFKMELALR